MQSALDVFIATQLFAFLLIFARIGAAMMTMPGFSDSTVPMNVRLYFTLAFSLMLTPMLSRYLPSIPDQPIAFAILIGKEMLIGVFMGLMAQIILNAINVAGFVIGHVTSLSSAFTFNPQQASQSTVVASFMSMTAVVLIFASDLHHMLFSGFVESYRLFAPTAAPMYGDMTNAMAESLGQSMMIGLQMSAPFIIVGFGIFIGMGLVARLVPQIQVFILSMPIQIMTGLILLATVTSAMMLFFLGHYQDFWMQLFVQ